MSFPFHTHYAKYVLPTDPRLCDRFGEMTRWSYPFCCYWFPLTATSGFLKGGKYAAQEPVATEIVEEPTSSSGRDSKVVRDFVKHGWVFGVGGGKEVEKGREEKGNRGGKEEVGGREVGVRK